MLCLMAAQHAARFLPPAAIRRFTSVRSPAATVTRSRAGGSYAPQCLA